MKIYYVASPGNWILVKAANKRAARSAGVNEYGRGRVAEVREATSEEVAYYLTIRPEISEWPG